MKSNKSLHIYGLFRTMKVMKAIAFVICMGVTTLMQAQGDEAPDFMRSIGKIYVVAGVCLLILVTLLAYMVLLDRKISRLEKRQKNE